MTNDASTPGDKLASLSAGTAAAPDPGANNRRILAIAVAALAVLVLVGGFYAVRLSAGAAAQVADMQAKIDALTQRAAALEARPLPTPPPPAPDLGPLQQRLTALENKAPPQVQLDKAGQDQIAAIASRVDGIAARQNLLGTQEQTDIGKLNEQLAAQTKSVNDQLTAEAGKVTTQLGSLDARLAAAAKTTADLTALDARATRTAQLQGAAAALTAGRPLGTIAGAPPALAQFATKAPPTEAQLRLSFDAAAAEARKAGQPYADTQPFLSRMWDRAQSGLVIREGDRVIVGDAVSGVLEHAKQLLLAGDLPGAVAALDGLAGPAATAMAPWRAQAQSLVDARAALISAARG